MSALELLYSLLVCAAITASVGVVLVWWVVRPFKGVHLTERREQQEHKPIIQVWGKQRPLYEMSGRQYLNEIQQSTVSN